MIGLIYLIAAGIFLALLVLATWGAYRWAAKRGLSKGKRWLAAGGGFLAVYLPVFWDYIPTVLAHEYYCRKDAGFWVYKTLDQWQKENPGVAVTLVATKGARSRYESYNDGHGKRNTYFLNQRFHRVVSRQDISSLLLIIRTEQQVIDAKTHDVLARSVDFGTGNSIKHTIGPPGPIKFWLHSANCDDGGVNGGKLSLFSSKARHLGEGGKE